MPAGYDKYGQRHGPATAAERAAVAERVRRQDEAHAARMRAHAAWDRLCGMAGPIGRAVDLPR